MLSENSVIKMHEDVAVQDTDCQHQLITTFERVSIKKNVIEGVHLVGFQAKNRVSPEKAPYVYKEAALKQAVPLYDNVDVYLSHGKGNDERPIESKVGFITNPRFKEGTGVVGDVVLNEGHTYFKAMMWWAEHKPSNLGMSHVATNLYNAKENAVVEVRKVHSVDIVSTPSTTNGLFKEGVIEDKVNETELEAYLNAGWSLISEIQWPLQGNKLPQRERAVKVLAVLKDLAKELGMIATPSTDTTKESDMELKDLTIDELKAKRSDLLAIIAKEAVELHVATETKIQESLKDVHETLKTELFVTLVREAVTAKDETKLAALIADRKAIVVAKTEKKDEVVTTQVESAAPAQKVVVQPKTLDRSKLIEAANKKR